MNKMMMNIQMLMFVLTLNIFSSNSQNSGPNKASALFVFGDSLFDNGNNNLLLTKAKANYPPYGMNFKKGPTGRFTNGENAADFIAEYLGLPYPPPYMSLFRGLLKPQKLTGLNYASGGSGILSQTGRLIVKKGLTLYDQIDLFERTVEEEIPKEYKNSEDVSNYLSKSVFLIATGTNDFLETQATSPAFVNLLILHLSNYLERLYKLGARKMIVFEIGPIGCIPSYTRNNGTCDDELNYEGAFAFNHKLKNMVRRFVSTHLDEVDLYVGHVYSLGHETITNPSEYGLKDASNSCCKTLSNHKLPLILHPRVKGTSV